jgi:hypothetical protein
MSSVFLPAGSAACIPMTRSQGPFAANGKSMVGATLAVALEIWSLRKYNHSVENL